MFRGVLQSPCNEKISIDNKLGYSILVNAGHVKKNLSPAMNPVIHVIIEAIRIQWFTVPNRPILRCCESHYESEAKCKAFL